ncbi:MAG: isoprenylcysteine carboxylmethyltransferase family protein [Phycisphaeraceae bacterium]|nr:isoprenylcysteine carboxylmethyltransferase family protein [Phycisphaeraceae bacterium]
MNSHAAPAYGLWALLLLNTGLIILFAASFFRPRTGRDWRTLGGFSAFVVALFAEMYGFPLTIYLLSGWLGGRLQDAGPASHDGGHLWFSLLRLHGDPHSHPVHLLSSVLVAAGCVLLASAWRALHSAQQRGVLAVSGPYGLVRHPQYVALVVIMLGFLLQWPTLATLLMFPVLTLSYVRLARREERRMAGEFECAWECYAHGRPAFVPRLSRVRGALAGLVRTDRPGKTGSPRGPAAATPATHGRTRS